MRNVLTAAATVAVLALGASACGSPAPASSTPQACMKALDLAEAALGHARTGLMLAAESSGAASDGFSAASRFDVSGMSEAADRIDDVNTRMGELTPQVSAAIQAYQAAAAECRTAG